MGERTEDGWIDWNALTRMCMGGEMGEAGSLPGVVAFRLRPMESADPRTSPRKRDSYCTSAVRLAASSTTDHLNARQFPLGGNSERKPAVGGTVGPLSSPFAAHQWITGLLQLASFFNSIWVDRNVGSAFGLVEATRMCSVRIRLSPLAAFRETINKSLQIERQ